MKFFFFFLFENIVDSPQNQSRNTCEKRELPRLQTKSTHSTARVKEPKKKKRNLYPEYRHFAVFPKTLGIKQSKRNIRRTTHACPHKVCVMQSCAKLLGIIILYLETIFLAKLCEIPRSNLTK